MLSALDGTPLSEHQKVGAIGLLASHTLDRLRIGEELSGAGRTAAVGTTADGASAARPGRADHDARVPGRAPGAAAGRRRWARSPSRTTPPSDDDELDFGTVLILDGIERLIALAS